ncbi:putative membrane-anchored protein [Kineosphaera limosa]|uniref:GDYXXLXY domain-containing protein n=1 Tax=Kineosphaera limosa NBRC 100340 TaxID=1184609 RepID=K6XBL4_9MICO|nr:GDYXXLXY domain-containing protein [Kineosphaera limosa]NYE03263.1 putative membrane-anchored protein [Kineosphaera limosa]GAB96214.1 hypothetical protein KILIM_033_00340 [Kineosphaera limosa NBRC 100340]
MSPSTSPSTTSDEPGPDAAAVPTAVPAAAPAQAPARRWRWLILALVVQLGLVGVAVAPQLQARFTGQEYRLRVAPIDPIDPFRGAYVALSYPDLPTSESMARDLAADPGTLSEAPSVGGHVRFVPLIRSGEVWRGAGVQRTRPDSGPYLTCRDRGWQLRCGIESWFVPQDRAAAIERAVGSGHAIAVVRIDSSGDAAIVDLLTDEG